MNFGELQNRLSFILNFNDGQVDEDFNLLRIQQALNYAYNREVQKAMLEGNREYWKACQNLVWPAGQITLALPAIIKKKALISIHDITSNEVGDQLYFDKEGLTGQVFFKDSSTLQWGTQGPGSSVTLRFYYLASPETMMADVDEPELIPDAFHEVIVWSAATWLKAIADDVVPDSWLQQLYDIRLDFWKYVSLGRPRSAVPQIEPLTEE